MKKAYLSILTIFFIIFSPKNIWAKKNEETKISQRSVEIEKIKDLKLGDILFYTFENNDELRAEREKLKAVETTKFRTLGENAFPDLYLNSRRGRKDVDSDRADQETKINHDTKIDEIVLSQPIFKSGRTKTSLKSVDNEIEIQKKLLFSKEQEILFRAIVSAVNILRTEVIYNIVKRNEESLRRGHEYSKARRKVGKTTVTEVSTANSRYKDALSDTARAKTRMLVAKANFEQVVGLNPHNVKFKQIDELFKYIDKYKISYDEVLEKALTQNPSYLVIKENYKLSKNNLSFNKTDFFPTLTLNAGASRGKIYSILTENAATRSNEAFINLDLRIPLIQSGVKYADYKAGGYSVNQSKFEMKNAKKVVREQSIKIYEEFLLTKELIQTAEAFMRATKIALDASMEESKVGKITIIELLDRRREFFISQIQIVEAKSNNILKFYSLKVLMGELDLTTLGIDKK